MDKVNYGSLPAILLAAVWGATDVVLKALEILNVRKDEILKIAREAGHQSPAQFVSALDQMNDLLWSDYGLLSFGIVGFCVVFATLVYKIPTFFRRGEEIEGMSEKQKLTSKETDESMRKLCGFVALFGIFGILAFGGGGIWDMIVLNHQIQNACQVNRAVNAPKYGKSDHR
jgi:hypothetical protein